MSEFASYIVTENPAVNIYDLTVFKEQYARIDTDVEDTILATLLKSSVYQCEAYTRRKFITQTVKAYFKDFQDLTINVSPIQSISSVKYYDSSNDLQTLLSSVYDANIIKEPAEITLAENQTYPTIRERPNAVEVEFIAGYGDAASDVPSSFIVAVYMLAAHYYDHRHSVTEKQYSEMPMGVKYILDPLRVYINK